MNSPQKPLVLIVDDEKDVRSVIRLMLENDGFEVMEADSGREAINLVSNAKTPITLMITDVLMPYMNGRELANRIASIRPSIKVLFISAYSAEILSNLHIDLVYTHFLRKPFNKKALLAAISKLLPHRILNAIVPSNENILAPDFKAQVPNEEPRQLSAKSASDA